MRLLYVVRPATGGIRQHIITLSRCLISDGNSIDFAAPEGFLRSLPPDLASQPAFPLDIPGSINPIKSTLASRRLGRLLNKGYDVVHSHGVQAGLVTALSAIPASARHVVTLHNLPGKDMLSRFTMGYMARRTNCFIAVSNSISDSLKGMLPSQTKIDVIPNGIPAAFYEQQIRDDSLGEETAVIGCVARLSREKGVDILLEAARRLPILKFIVAGDGPDRATLGELAPANVTFLGRIEDVRSIYSRSRILVIPSRREGQGIVALEALAAGCPIVASDVGGLADMLTEGMTALLVPVGDVTALCEAINLLISDDELRERLKKNGRSMVRARFGDSDMARNVTELYNTVVTPRPTA